MSAVRGSRIALIALAMVLAGLLAVLFLFYLSTMREVIEPSARPVYRLSKFSALAGWEEDDHRAAFAAFQASCAKRLSRPAESAIAPRQIAGTVEDWRDVCRRALGLSSPDRREARSFFEAEFRPLAVSAGDEAEGLFTGYFEPEIAASRTRSAGYTIPLYRRPGDLVSVDLGKFRDDLAGRRIAGRVVDGRLEPYATRGEIANGALASRGLELLWADDPVSVFMLQIQGSGRARLPDGETLRLGFAGHNGHAYTSLGKLMVARGLLAPEEVSAPAIAAWLRAHPEDGAELMRENAAYVFFRILDGEGPIGSQGVALTPGRSLAVDESAIPLGAPVWLATGRPDPETPERAVPLKRLMIAQDTGSAIDGVVRGDVFWGAGETAERIAGHMAHRGRYWLLLPTPLAERVAGGVEPVS